MPSLKLLQFHKTFYDSETYSLAGSLNAIYDNKIVIPELSLTHFNRYVIRRVYIQCRFRIEYKNHIIMLPQLWLA